MPLKLSAKFQINLAMSDVKTMAHVEKFSHLTIPMLWFEIGLYELPERLEKRFSLYLNILPMVEKVALYACLALGGILSVIAVSQVALRTSKSIASQKCHQKFNRNLIYAPCEEKLIDEKSKKPPQQTMTKLEDEESNGSECADVITRHDQYELEEDDALSDIDYSEIHIDEESASSSSEPVCAFIHFFSLFLAPRKRSHRQTRSRSSLLMSAHCSSRGRHVLYLFSSNERVFY